MGESLEFEADSDEIDDDFKGTSMFHPAAKGIAKALMEKGHKHVFVTVRDYEVVIRWAGNKTSCLVPPSDLARFIADVYAGRPNDQRKFLLQL
jgi:hypothetical protein